jgi:predicted neuraminidase/peroxiredoxin
MIWTPIFLAALAGPLSLQTLEGESFTLDNYGERRATVVVFLSARCPFGDPSIEAINETYEEYRQRRVLFVGLFANEAEDQDEIRTFCQRRGVRFPFYRDPNRPVAEKLGASHTAEAFLLGASGEVLYHGGFSPAEAAADFRETVSLLVSGSTPTHSDFPSHGTPLDEQGAPREIDDPYGNVAFSSELIFESIPGAPAHHCSTLAEAPNGDLLCVWYGGSYESSDDQSLFIARRRKGEGRWDLPQVLIQGSAPHPPGNAIIFRLGAERLGLMWGRMESTRPIRRGFWGACRLMYRTSEDNGLSWSPDREMTELPSGLPRNIPIRLADGNLLLPLSARKSFLADTSDEGITWRVAGELPVGGQVTLIETLDSSLLAFIRSRPHILRSMSHDRGATWSSPVETELPCPGSGIALCRLASGNLVLAFNNSSEDRTPLCIARSTDEGQTWEPPLALESNPGEYSYPCVIQTADGRIHVTYTYRRYSIMHVELNEDWLVHTERPN